LLGITTTSAWEEALGGGELGTRSERAPAGAALLDGVEPGRRSPGRTMSSIGKPRSTAAEPVGCR